MFPLYGSTVESLSRRQGLTIKLSSDRTKFHQKSVIDFFIHVMTFSRCRRLNVHRKTGYPSFLYPLANVRPLTTMSWRGNWCILELQKDGNQFFTMFHLFSSFCYLERGMSAVLHRKHRMTHCFIDFRWRRPVDIPGWQPYIAVPSVKGQAFNWLQVHQNPHHLFKCWTEWHLFIAPLYSQIHSHSYTKDYLPVQSCVLLRPNHCMTLYVT